MHKLYLIIIATLFNVSLISAQQQGPHIAFDKTVHDYGTINEQDGVAKYKFEFTNTGSTPLIINRVNPTCGCTSSEHTRKPVNPGEKGFVSAEYNPKNRPGPFSKTIRVYSNSADNPSIVLRIKGKVNPRPRSIEDDYPRKMGAIRLNNNQFAFMHVTNREKKLRQLKIVNVSDKPVTLSMKRVPKYIDVSFKPKTLKPGEKGTISATFHGEKTTDLDYMRGRMSLVINGNENPRHRIATTAIVKQDFSHLTAEERANAPHIKFEDTKFDFGTITEGAKVTHEFKFTNTGKSNLIIKKVRASCGCTAVAPPKKAIKPGESSSIKATFHSRGKRNRQHKSIRIYANDPDNSVTTLIIRGTVKKK
ncbi:hypothetical protein L21SP5_03323 [Salinivirga cyanobacteriivorans]|uniref:DUF1573 domain-containing protein n=1 Tax=Salinivirga cyanobacteriivorans TaxID=1307839 RepID=A0A0S2I3D9_9BACT|nr:DUF1573 domain-containing protein [Salinivirga cyanobacteriivorans]ALO16936.1 hypothetical protein L21SP5_03323 [Salinivirga cyanobacteriivorans]